MKSMKRKFLIFAFTVVSAASFGQSEPDFELEPFVFNSIDSTFTTPLPCESTYNKSKAGASLFLTGVGKVKSYCYINGVNSPLVIDKRTSDIIINTDGTSPQQILTIIKLETLGKKRRWKTSEIGTFTGTSLNEDSSIALKYNRYGENSVIIDTSVLEPGEYCLAITYKMTNYKLPKVYTFRIK